MTQTPYISKSQYKIYDTRVISDKLNIIGV